MSLEHDPARQKLRGRRQQARAPPDETIDAMSIAEFCRRHSLSEALYHKLQKRGLGPKTFKAGARTLITTESAAAWRKAQERAASKQSNNLKTGNVGARPGA
jgi:hypothetical protein